MKYIGENGLKAIQAPTLECDGISHGFFSRIGGVSSGIYDGLNCGNGSNDSSLNVAENRMMVAAALSNRRDTPIITPYQIHGNNVISVDGPWSKNPEKADSIVTKTPGIVIGILTADCTPIIFYDPKARVIAAAHAGWKGAKAGIIAATLNKMEELGANRHNIHAAIGPTLAQSSYEVTKEFLDTFVAQSSDNQRYFIQGKDGDHWQFDLPQYVQDELESEKLGSVWNSNIDTYADSDHFYSYRRTTHKGETDYGRLISAIMLHGGP